MQPETATLFSLADLKSGEQAVLAEIRAGMGLTGRMGSLGFTPGAVIEMTQNYGYGPLVVTVRGARVALGRQEARRAIVRRVEK